MSLKVMPVQMEMSNLPKPSKTGHKNFAEAMRDPMIPIDRKLKTIKTICDFETLNGITKDDLHEMLKVVYRLLMKR